MRLAPLLVLYLIVCAVAQPDGAVRDEPALLAAAERLVEHGQWAGTGTDPDQRAYLWHGPGLVVLLAPFVALGAPLELIRLAAPLLLFAAVALFHRLLLLRLAPRPALAFSYALGLYAPFVIVLGTVQKEPLALLLVVAAMYACARALAAAARRPLTWAAATGLAVAALGMVRLEYGWVILALLGASLLTARRAPRRVAIAAVAALACVPWLAYTERQTGESLYWGSSSGLSLFWMSPTLPGQNGQWHSPVRVYRDPALAPLRPLFHRLDEVHPLDSDRELRRLAIANIRARPLGYVRNLIANSGRLLVFAPTRPARPTAALAMYGLGNGLLLAGLLWAAPGLWRRRRALPAEAGPFAAFAVLAVALHIPPSASPRMLMPVVPVLLWLIVHARAAAAPPAPAPPAPAGRAAPVRADPPVPVSA